MFGSIQGHDHEARDEACTLVHSQAGRAAYRGMTTRLTLEPASKFQPCQADSLACWSCSPKVCASPHHRVSSVQVPKCLCCGLLCCAAPNALKQWKLLASAGVINTHQPQCS